MENYFQYGEKEISYLKSKDKRLSEVIDRIGTVKRTVIPDLFTAMVHSITGQQISTKAHETIWARIQNKIGDITPENIMATPCSELRALGISLKKVEYIMQAAQKISDRKTDFTDLQNLSDEDVCNILSQLNGIGVWSAEMLMLFSMQRPNILSYGDLAIQRGLRMIYHHRKIDRKLFARYRRRFSPYCSVASLYIWAVAGGAIPEMKDYAPKSKKK